MKRIIYIFLLNLILVSGVQAAGWNPSNYGGYGLPGAPISKIITNLMYWLLYLFGFIGVIGFVISGIMYLVAAGDETLIGRAKKGMTYSLIGIIVGLSGIIVIKTVQGILGTIK